jgi:hypothetical protein
LRYVFDFKKQKIELFRISLHTINYLS